MKPSPWDSAIANRSQGPGWRGETVFTWLTLRIELFSFTVLHLAHYLTFYATSLAHNAIPNFEARHRAPNFYHFTDD
jgi:hypothetical protein